MKLCRIAVFVAAASSMACGSSEDSGQDKKKVESSAAGSGLQALNSASGADSPDEKKAPSGAYAKGGVGTTKSLFGGRFKGMLTGGKALTKGDLTTIFGAASKPTMTPVAPVAKGSAVRASTSRSDALWAYSPPDAAFGLVLADGSLEELTAAISEAGRVLGAHPMGAKLLEMMRAETADAGIDVLNLAAWASKSGIDLTKGAAFFASSGGDVAVVLPVVDPAAFRKAIQDDEGKLGDAHCVVAAPGRYICGEKLAYVQAAAKQASQQASPLAQRVKQLPPWLRGDAELVAHLASFPGAMQELTSLRPALETIGTIALAAQLDHGTISLRGWLEGKRGGKVGSTFASLPPAALSGESAGSVNWFHFRIPMALLTAKMPATLPIGPIDMRKVLIDNMTGEMVTYSRGKTFLAEEIVVGLRDGSITARAIEGVCGLLIAEKVLPNVKKGTGACGAKVDLAMLLAKNKDIAPFVKGMPPVPVKVAVKGNKLTLTVGWPTGKGRDNAGSAIARELQTGNWNFVFWGLGLDPLGVAPKVLKQRVAPLLDQALDGEEKMTLSLIRWLYGHMYDAGLAVALRDDGIYGLMQITTYAADPPAAYAAHEVAVKALAKNDFAGYRSSVTANAAKLRGTLAGRHATVVKGGAPLLGQAGVWGLLAGIGIVNKKEKKEDGSAGHHK